MSFTTIIAGVSSALHYAESRADNSITGSSFQNLVHKLRQLKTFLYCSKKLHKDASLKHFLTQIEEKLQKEAVESLNYRQAKTYTNSLMEEMSMWYVTMLDRSCSPDSTSLTINEILDIIASILESIYGDIDLLKVQLRFLKSLIHFVTKGSTEACLKDLLDHSESFAINTAYVLFQFLNNESFLFEDKLLPEVSALLQRMMPINPRVYQIYTQSLIGSKLSNQWPDDDAFLAVKNFLDSLLSNFPDILYLHPCHMVLMKDQLLEMYERLTSLKIILKLQPMATFGMEIREEIADVVADVGIATCSLYQPQIDVNSGHQNLLDKFNVVLFKIAEIIPKKPIFSPPRTSSYGYVDCLLEKLMDLKFFEGDSISKRHFQTIQVELTSIRSSLGDVVELSGERVEFQTLWNCLLKVAFKVENAIDYKVVNPLSDSFATSFDSDMQDIGNIKAAVLKINGKEVRRGAYSHLPSETISSTSNEVIGFQDEERAVLDRLRGGPQHLRLIGIVGMPGLGKTTLAKKIYNQSSLSYHFSVKAWCTVSQVLDRKKVLFDLLKQICPGISSEMSEHDLANELRRSLKRKRYLIFLDDIWSSEAWNVLRDSFPDDPEAKGSRIIFTSRSLDIAPCEILDQEPLILSPLSERDSWNLLCIKLFPGQINVLPPALHALGMQIVARCGGIPLAIIIIVGVLANVEADDWGRILGDFSFLSSEANCRHTWEFSYNHLPGYLRPCFLCFGFFPEDHEISVRRLLRLWIAEGFVRKSEKKSPEDVAEGYLNMLIGRSLIMVSKRRSDGGVKTCRIHDLLRDFCLEKAKDEQFSHFTKVYDELYAFDDPHNLRRLIIDYEALRESDMYCHTSFDTRSLQLRGSNQYYKGMWHMLKSFKLLKVLDLEQVFICDEFPSAIEPLVLLAFLAIRGSGLTVPSWLANLSNLETLIIIKTYPTPSGNLWNMQKLKFLCIKDYGRSGGVLPIDNLDDSDVLCELDRFTGAIIDWCSMEKQMRKFPNVRKLKCLLSGKLKHGDKFEFPDFSSKLESLDMAGKLGYGVRVRFGFASLTNLKKLKLSDLCLYWEIFSVIGNQLPSLEVLNLRGLTFKDEEEYVWEMKFGEFSKLRILHLGGTIPFRRWIACDDHEFECFQKLVLDNCRDLVELPSSLESIETLEEIELSYCSKTVEDLVAKIEEAQTDWGNSGLKISCNLWR